MIRLTTTPTSEPVVPEEGSRLYQLAARYAELKPRADEANERLKAVTDALKAELANARPGERTVLLRLPVLDLQLRLSAKDSWRCDTKQLKAQYPAIYAYCAKKQTSWELRQA